MLLRRAGTLALRRGRVARLNHAPSEIEWLFDGASLGTILCVQGTLKQVGRAT